METTRPPPNNDEADRDHREINILNLLPFRKGTGDVDIPGMHIFQVFLA